MIDYPVLILILMGIYCLARIKKFFSKYRLGIYYIEKDDGVDFDESSHISMLGPENYNKAIDLRGTPTHQCVCGSSIWNLKVIFDQSEIATYFLDMECANCGSLATAPTPIDKGYIE